MPNDTPTQHPDAVITDFVDRARAESENLATLAAEFRRQFPGAAKFDPRCLAVLRALAPFYRLPIVNTHPAPMIPLAPEHWEEARVEEAYRTGEYPTLPRDDGGVAAWGGSGGLSVVLRTEVSTFDSDELTRLVLAAHRWHCRVAVGEAYEDESEAATWEPRLVGVRLGVTPRKVDGDLITRHPGLASLAARCSAP